MTVFHETLLGMHVNPIAYLILLVSTVMAVHAAATHHQTNQGSGMDVDDSPSGWALISCCLLICAGLITSSATAVRHESVQLAQDAHQKYGVAYLEDGAHSRLAHLVTAKNTVRVNLDGQETVVFQEVDPTTREVTLLMKEGGPEISPVAP